jgi:hypothetical protein
MKSLIPLILIAALLGCKAKTPKLDYGPSLGTGIAKTQGHISAIQNGLKLLPEYCDATGKVIVKTMEWAAEKAQESAASSQYWYEVLNKDLQGEHASRVEAERRVKEEQDQWLGDKSWHYIHWIIGVIVGGWILLGITGALLPLFGFTGLSMTIMRALPLSNIFALIRDRFVSPASVTRVLKPRTPREPG